MEGKISMSFDKKAYQREYMRKRRAKGVPDRVFPEKQDTLASLRALIKTESEKPSEETVVDKPLVYRDDYGRVISEAQYDKLQKMKEHAKANNFEMDEYSQ